MHARRLGLISSKPCLVLFALMLLDTGLEMGLGLSIVIVTDPAARASFAGRREAEGEISSMLTQRTLTRGEGKKSWRQARNQRPVSYYSAGA